MLGIAGTAGLAPLFALIGVFLFSNQSTRTSDGQARIAPGVEVRSQQGTVQIDLNDTRRLVPPESGNVAIETADIANRLRPSAPVDPLIVENKRATLRVDDSLGWPTFEAAEQRFALQRRDAAWSTQAEADILRTLSLIPDLHLLQIELECRESLCLLRLLFPPGSATTYALRQIYSLAESIGLGPVSAETGIEGGSLPVLRLFLRRKH